MRETCSAVRLIGTGSAGKLSLPDLLQDELIRVNIEVK
jgi:hypothetical protein